MDLVPVLSSLILLGIVVTLALSIAALVWAYRDGERRGQSGLLVALLVAVTGPIGLVVWLLVRPSLASGPAFNEQGGRVM